MDEEERRIRDRRVKDIEDGMCAHIKKADEKWESIEVHIAEMKDMMKKLDGVDFESLKVVADIVKGSDTMGKFVISMSKVVGAFLILLGAFIALIKFAIK